MNSHGTIKLFDLATRTICTSDATSNELHYESIFHVWVKQLFASQNSKKYLVKTYYNIYYTRLFELSLTLFTSSTGYFVSKKLPKIAENFKIFSTERRCRDFRWRRKIIISTPSQVQPAWNAQDLDVTIDATSESQRDTLAERCGLWSFNQRKLEGFSAGQSVREEPPFS